MTVKVSVTVTQVREDGTEGPVDGELAAALAGPAGRFSEMLSWTAWQARPAGSRGAGERACGVRAGAAAAAAGGVVVIADVRRVPDHDVGGAVLDPGKQEVGVPHPVFRQR